MLANFTGTLYPSEDLQREGLPAVQEELAKRSIKSDGIRQKLIDLRKCLAPTDLARKLELASEYRQLMRAPRSQDIKKWLFRWERVYSEDVAIDLHEVQEKRSVHDFLNTIESLDAAFTATARALIYRGTSDPTRYDIVEEFRNTTRLSTARQRAETYSAFATFKE